MKCISRQSEKHSSSFFPNSKPERWRKDSEGMVVESVKFPLTREVLWDRSPQGVAELLHLTAKRNLRLYVNEKTLMLAARHLQKKSTFDGFLVGSVTVDPEEDGTVLTVDRFDPGREMSNTTGLLDHPLKVPTTIVPGDHIIPLELLSGLELAEKSLVQSAQFERIFDDIQHNVCGRESVNTSQLLVFRSCIHCHRDELEVIFNLHFAAVTVSTCIQATPICTVPIIPTALARNLTGPLRLSELRGKPKCGYLTMDHTRKLLLLLESDPKAYSLPLIGIWVSGVFGIQHPYVWACCVRFLHCRAIEERVTVPSNGFLLLHYSPAQSEPDFYECSTTEEQMESAMFELHSCYDNLHLDLPSGSRSLEPICFDLLPAPDGATKACFTRALGHWMTESKRPKPPSNELPEAAAAMVLDTNEDEFLPRPSPSPHPQSTQAPFVFPAVPEVSLCVSFEDSSPSFDNDKEISDNFLGNRKTSPKRKPGTPQLPSANLPGKRRASPKCDTNSPRLPSGKENSSPLVPFSYPDSPITRGRLNAKEVIASSNSQVTVSREPLKPISNSQNRKNAERPRRNSSRSTRELTLANERMQTVNGTRRLSYENSIVASHSNASNYQLFGPSQKGEANRNVSNLREAQNNSNGKRHVLCQELSDNSKETDSTSGKGNLKRQGNGPAIKLEQKNYPGKNAHGQTFRNKDGNSRQRHLQNHQREKRAREINNREVAHSNQCRQVLHGSEGVLNQNDSGFTSTDCIVVSPSQNSDRPSFNNVSERQDDNRLISTAEDTAHEESLVELSSEEEHLSKRRSSQSKNEIEEEFSEVFHSGSPDSRENELPSRNVLVDMQTRNERDVNDKEIFGIKKSQIVGSQNRSRIASATTSRSENLQATSVQRRTGSETHFVRSLSGGAQSHPDPYEMLKKQEVQLKLLQEQIQVLLQQQNVHHPPPGGLLTPPHTPVLSVEQKNHSGFSQTLMNKVSACTNTGASLLLGTPVKAPGKISAATSPICGTPPRRPSKRSAATSPITQAPHTEKVHVEASNYDTPLGGEGGEDTDTAEDLTSQIMVQDDDPSQTIASSLHAVDIHSFQESPNTSPQSRNVHHQTMDINSITSPVLGESASVYIEKSRESPDDRQTQPAPAASLLFRNERQFYDNLLNQVKLLLDEQVNEETSVHSEQTVGTSCDQHKSPDVTVDKEPTREDVVKATIQELEKIKTHSSNDMEDFSQLQDSSITTSGLLHRSVSLSAIPDYPRINYVSLSIDDSLDLNLLSDADRITLKYLSEEQRKELPKVFNRRSRNRTVRFQSNPSWYSHKGPDLSEVEFSFNNLSVATKEYLEKYNLMGKRQKHKEISNRRSSTDSIKSTQLSTSPKAECTAPPPTPDMKTADGSSSNVLDMKKLRNLPKLF